MKRITIMVCILVLLVAAPLMALSTVRAGKPRIRFNRLLASKKAEQGDRFQISAFITPIQNIWEDEGVFFHIIKPDAVMKEHPSGGWTQKGIVINANMPSTIPSKRWIVGEDVHLGPATIVIPDDMPPGEYLYQMGLYHYDADKDVYVREPYTNEDIKDWIVGTLLVKKRAKTEEGKHVELMLSNFETLTSVKSWETGRGGEVGLVKDALDGNYSGLFAFPAGTYLPIVMLESFFQAAAKEYREWNQYDYLEFMLGADFSTEGYSARNISIQVKDATGGRFQRRLEDIGKTSIAERIYSLRLPVDDISQRIDTTNVQQLGFYAAGLPEVGDWNLKITVDNIKLVAEEGLKRDWTEPFVLFEGLESPKTVFAGDRLQLAPSFSIARKFKQNYSLFVHLIQEEPPYFARHLERRFFREPKTWEVGKIYKEGPFDIHVPDDAPEGKYRLDIGLYRTLPTGSSEVHYVNVCKWADGEYTEEQADSSGNYIKLPYLNKTSKTRWTVGEVTVLARGKKRPPEKASDEKVDMDEIVTFTEKEIIHKQSDTVKTQGGIKDQEGKGIPKNGREK